MKVTSLYTSLQGLYCKIVYSYLCYLIKMQLSIKKIAFIMHITSSGVSQCRRRLYKKFTGEPQNTEKFDKFIADF